MACSPHIIGDPSRRGWACVVPSTSSTSAASTPTSAALARERTGSACARDLRILVMCGGDPRAGCGRPALAPDTESGAGESRALPAFAVETHPPPNPSARDERFVSEDPRVPLRRRRGRETGRLLASCRARRDPAHGLSPARTPRRVASRSPRAKRGALDPRDQEPLRAIAPAAPRLRKFCSPNLVAETSLNHRGRPVYRLRARPACRLDPPAA